MDWNVFYDAMEALYKENKHDLTIRIETPNGEHGFKIVFTADDENVEVSGKGRKADFIVAYIVLLNVIKKVFENGFKEYEQGEE